MKRGVHDVLYSTPGNKKGDFMHLHFYEAREEEKTPSLGSRGEHLPGAPGRHADKQLHGGNDCPGLEFLSQKGLGILVPGPGCLCQNLPNE